MIYYHRILNIINYYSITRNVLAIFRKLEILQVPTREIIPPKKYKINKLLTGTQHEG